MKLDKQALEQIAQDFEVDLEQEDGVPCTDEEKLEIRSNVASAIDKYFIYVGARNKDETFESLIEARESLYSIYNQTQRTRQALALATKPENIELAEILDSFMKLLRIQAEAVFGEMN